MTWRRRWWWCKQLCWDLPTLFLPKLLHELDEIFMSGLQSLCPLTIGLPLGLPFGLQSLCPLTLGLPLGPLSLLLGPKPARRTPAGWPTANIRHEGHTSIYGSKAHTSTYGTKATNDIQDTKADNLGCFIPWMTVESGDAVPVNPNSLVYPPTSSTRCTQT